MRIVFIGAVALTMVLLLQRWVIFNNPTTLGNDIVASQNQSIAEPITPAANNVAPPNSQTEETLLPKAVTTISRVEKKQRPDNIQADTKWIKIHTDVLEVHINPKGGDIEYWALKQYPQRIETPDQALVLIEKNQHYPFWVQSGLLSKTPFFKDGKIPHYQSKQSTYRFDQDQDRNNLEVTLNYDESNNLQLKKVFVFDCCSYKVQIKHSVSHQKDETYHLSVFGQLQRTIGSETGNGNLLTPNAFSGVAIGKPQEAYKKFDLDDLNKKPIQHSTINGWIALVQHYFVNAWVPEKDVAYNYRAYIHKNNRFIANVVGPTLEVAAGETKEFTLDFYAGPKNQKNLKELAYGLDLTVDYGWLWWLAQPLSKLLILLESLVHNWGLAIIGLTLVVKLLFYPLSNIGYRSMARMRIVQPKIVELRDRYKDDRQKLSQEMMALYRNHKINPLGGCLPILVQMPVFLALYWVLLEGVELRQAPFFGWIKDLSTMDPWFILPLLMGVSMYVQQKMNPTPADPTQAMIFRWLPIIFTVFFLFFPAGLVLYWLSNNILSMLQQWWIQKSMLKAVRS